MIEDAPLTFTAFEFPPILALVLLSALPLFLFYEPS